MSGGCLIGVADYRSTIPHWPDGVAAAGYMLAIFQVNDDGGSRGLTKMSATGSADSMNSDADALMMEVRIQWS